MDCFNIVVGLFSILGSIASIVSVGFVISIKNQISIKGNKNKTKIINQTNHGKNNQNLNY